MEISPRSLEGRGRILIAGGLLAFFSFVTHAWATTVLAVSADDLVTRSHTIVHASCDAAESFRNDRGQICTRYTFRIHESFKGVDNRVIEFVQPGGEIDGKRLVIPGLSGYQRDDEVFLFLTEEYRGDRRLPVGLDQGVYRVVTPKNGGERKVRRNLAALKFVDDEAESVTVFPENVSVAKFRAAVDARIEELDE